MSISKPIEFEFQYGNYKEFVYLENIDITNFKV